MLRRLTQNDIPQCLHIAKANWGIDIAQSCVVELGQAFNSAVWKPNFYVAEEDQRVIGFAGYAASWMHYSIQEITWVNVDPSYHRNGIGRGLVNQCIDDIQAVGSVIMLSTTIPEYYEKWWSFKRCFEKGIDTIMWLDLT
jgi:GNAT superfamily N-acetyltransferase